MTVLYSLHPALFAASYLEVFVDRVQTEPASLSAPTFFQLQEEERYRLAVALMDGPGQVLANALFELEHSLALIELKPEEAKKGITAIREEIRLGLSELKAFVTELQPALLTELGLGPSLKQYVDTFGIRHDIQVECHGCDSLRERLPSVMEIAVFRIVQEALSNVTQHSGATSVTVDLARIDNKIRVSIEDNGRGFGPRNEKTQKRRPLGLVAMKDRAALVGGNLQIFSQPGKGLRVVVTVPYHSDHLKFDSATGGPYESREDEERPENQNTGKRITPSRSGQTGPR